MIYTSTSGDPSPFYYLPYSADKYKFEIKKLKDEVRRLQILNKNSEDECELLREKNEELKNDLRHMYYEYAKYMYMYDKLVAKYSEHVKEMTTLIVKAEEGKE